MNIEKAYLGIELGSTRIKAVLIGEDFKPFAQGSHQWENRLENGLWTYSLEDIRLGLQDCYRDLCKNLGTPIKKVAGIGISAMMHGYMPFDAAGNLLVPFRTWRNTNTGKAAGRLSELFGFNIPLRWSISHLYEAILDNEPHVSKISFLTTLAGYVHMQLTGEKVLGIGDASGMIPVDSTTASYDKTMIEKFDSISGVSFHLADILPKPLLCGAQAGKLTPDGARFLDPSGVLEAGIPFCPPEGDAGTGMVATNAVSPRTGNVSAGTSAFSMIVLEKALSRPYSQIDMVTTPDGWPVAMVHCNNCTSDLNGWVGIFSEFLELMGHKVDTSDVYTRLFASAANGDADCGGLLSYNFVSGEPVVGLDEGRPLFVRSAQDSFTLSNFMRSILYSTVGALKAGNDLLLQKEHVRLDRLTGHGGLFKSGDVGQRILAAALNSPISVMETAGEGGAWGMALLAAYPGGDMPLAKWLDDTVFADSPATTVQPDPREVEGFAEYLSRYTQSLAVEQKAIETKK